MFDVTKFDFWSVVAFVIPGLLAFKAYEFGRSWSIKKPSADEAPAYLTIAVLYLFFTWTWGYALPSGSSISSLDPGRIFQIYFLIPLLVGGGFGIFVQYKLLRKLLAAFGAPLPDEPVPIRTPWANVIGKIEQGTYLLIRMKDGSIYRALVTEDSEFSSDRNMVDIFVGQTYEGDNWTPANPPKSVYIIGSEIQAIEIVQRPT
jgi:hypothetical protein